jgi:hypothetical protein
MQVHMGSGLNRHEEARSTQGLAQGYFGNEQGQMKETAQQEREATRTQSRYKVEATIRRRVDRGVKAEVVDIYEEILVAVWGKITPTLGKTTVYAIAQRALHLAAQGYPTLDSVTVAEDGFNFRSLKERVDEKDKAAIREALRELIVSLFDILAKLTGNALVDRLTREIEGLDDIRGEHAA